MAQRKYTYVVEHLDPELGPWSALEYKTIGEECKAAGSEFLLSSVPQSLLESVEMHNIGVVARSDSVESSFAHCKSRVCLLDPAAKEELSPSDAATFNVFLFGGILGDDPPRDRTSELRNKGFEGRRLGPKQMTTDTAARVTRLVVQDQVPLDKIPYVDFPELKLNEHESTEMPFRYIANKDGTPVMPPGMIDLIKADTDKGFDNLEFADEVESMQNMKVG